MGHGVNTVRSSCFHRGLTVTKRPGLSKTRRYTVLNGVSTDLDFGVHNSTIVNLERGVLERVFYVQEDGNFVRPPRPSPGVFADRLHRFKTLLCRRLPPTTPIRYKDFPTLYWGRKRTIYQNAVDSLYREDVKATDAVIKCFVKAEKINFSAKKNPAPRIISPRNPRYNVAVGCYLKPVEHMLYDSIGEVFGSPTITKGLNVHQVGTLMHNKWRKFQKPVAVGLDASRFDQHVSREALQWEHSVYNTWFKHDRKLEWLLTLQLRNKCRGYTRDGKLKYTTDGTRMSGDMNTAMGNCLIMCALVYSFAREMNVPIELVNNGDDCVVIMSQTHLHKFIGPLPVWFREMGFTMKVEKPVTTLEQIEFCQMHPVWDGLRWVMVRKPSIAIAKDCISIKPLDSEKLYKKWLGAVGEGGLSLTGGIPIMQEFYCCLERQSCGLRLRNDPTMDTGWWHLTRGMARKYAPVTPETRVSFYNAFGILPDMQIAVEKFYRNARPIWNKPMLGYALKPNIWCY